MTNELSGTWYNQHGSVVKLEQQPDGRLTGTFTSATGLAASAGPCELVGFSADDLITFTVDFGRHGSLAAWTGHRTTHGGEPVLHLLWHVCVVVPSSRPEADLWKGVWTGADVFAKKKSTAETSAWPPSHPLPDWP